MRHDPRPRVRGSLGDALDRPAARMARGARAEPPQRRGRVVPAGRRHRLGYPGPDLRLFGDPAFGAVSAWPADHVRPRRGWHRRGPHHAGAVLRGLLRSIPQPRARSVHPRHLGPFQSIANWEGSGDAAVGIQDHSAPRASSARRGRTCHTGASVSRSITLSGFGTYPQARRSASAPNPAAGHGACPGAGSSQLERARAVRRPGTRRPRER